VKKEKHQYDYSKGGDAIGDHYPYESNDEESQVVLLLVFSTYIRTVEGADGQQRTLADDDVEGATSIIASI
jgi:hypothetical protein